MVEVLSEAVSKEHFMEWEVPNTPDHTYVGSAFENKVKNALGEYEDKLSDLFLAQCRDALAYAFSEYFGKLRVELYPANKLPDMQLEIATLSDCFDGLEMEPMSLKQIILDTASGFDNSEEVMVSIAKRLRALARHLEREAEQAENKPGTASQP